MLLCLSASAQERYLNSPLNFRTAFPSLSLISTEIDPALLSDFSLTPVTLYSDDSVRMGFAEASYADSGFALRPLALGLPTANTSEGNPIIQVQFRDARFQPWSTNGSHIPGTLKQFEACDGRSFYTSSLSRNPYRRRSVGFTNYGL